MMSSLISWLARPLSIIVSVLTSLVPVILGSMFAVFSLTMKWVRDLFYTFIIETSSLFGVGDAHGLIDQVTSAADDFNESAQVLANFGRTAAEFLPVVECLSIFAGAYTVKIVIRFVRHMLGLVPTLNAG